MNKFRIACFPLLAAPILWCVAVAEGVPRETTACSHALDWLESPPQVAAPYDSGASSVWSDLRVSLALPGAERPSLPRHLPLICGSPSPDGATKVEDGVLHCASVHPPPLA